ncbi:MAG: hypothetical protein ACFFBP_04810 [Promethearchaeota archaeon]
MVIKIEGAKENNLKNINVTIEDGITVVTGISGSGKTSLIFDTLYKEARRRFLEAFSVRKDNLQLNPAKVDRVTGLGPTIALGQNLLNRNPNSIVASATGLIPLFKLLFSRYGVRKCHHCGEAIHFLKEEEIVVELLGISKKEDIELCAELVNKVLGSHKTLIDLLENNFPVEEIIIDNKPWNKRDLDPKIPHSIQIKIGIIQKTSNINEIRKLIELSASLGANSLIINGETINKKIARVQVCIECGTWLSNLEPTHFNFSCPYCQGKGCANCNHTGLHPFASTVKWSGLLFNELLDLTIREIDQLFNEADIYASDRLVYEITRRLKALLTVGLDYLTLIRSMPTLSRGESQRIRLAMALLSELEDITHILDEPTIGQHPSDVARLLPIFDELKGPVIYIEHDRQAAIHADHVIDLGPGAGMEGGEILFVGKPLGLWKANTSSGKYFSLRDKVNIPKHRPKPQKFLKIKGAHMHNLKNIDVIIPLNRLTVITGVSGSGKSTLIEHVLYPSLHKKKAIGCKAIDGFGLKAVLVDQGPIGKNPRSNPATYTKIADYIRNLYAKESSYTATHFSFNTEAGACLTCKGMGSIEIKMRYLPSTWIKCSDCDGKRFSDEILSEKISFGEKKLSIADFYDHSISEIQELFKTETRIPVGEVDSVNRMLKALSDIGLGYLSLGQPSPTLSGGEAQRIKLSKYLGRTILKNQIILLDEPSTGLHPQDLNGLLLVLNNLIKAGATIIIIEHNIDIIRAADWIIDLGPGSGPNGGKVIHEGPLSSLLENKESLTAKALLMEDTLTFEKKAPKKAFSSPHIKIKNARIHNLKNINVDIPKNKFTVVTGVSGSGKSSLVINTLEAEAKRRYLETLSMYERQSTKETSEALVDEISGLGMTTSITPEKLISSWFQNVRHDIGNVTNITNYLANLFSHVGVLTCSECGEKMLRNEMWICKNCNITRRIAQPKHFISSNYSAACQKCNGVGFLHIPNPEKLIIHPEKPLCGGAMYSPGFFPKGYLCKPYNGGYYIVQALAEKFGFDPFKTPWNEMTSEAKNAFLYGTEVLLNLVYENKKGVITESKLKFDGFYEQWLRDWDIGGTYSDIIPCKACDGTKLRPEYLEVTINGKNIYELSESSLEELKFHLKKISLKNINIGFVQNSLKVILTKLNFLIKTGLGYLNLNRLAQTLSAGEAQRVRLANLVGSDLTNLTVLLDEPSRGLHPSEIQSLINILVELREKGNTIIVIEHDILFMEAADYIIDIGPNSGSRGGEIVAKGTLEEIKKSNTLTGQWLNGKKKFNLTKKQRVPKQWLKLYGARENNLKIDFLEIPLGLLVGFCGVSGSGKSSLLIDILGRILVPKKITTSVAHEPIEPGLHERIEGAPTHTIIIDQTKAKIGNPLTFLGLKKLILKIFADTEDAHILGLTEKVLGKPCSACKGNGFIKIDMNFLPNISEKCDACQGKGFQAEASQVYYNDINLAQVNELSIEDAYHKFKDQETIKAKLKMAMEVGLGYLILNQPARTLSGGEAQRLKIAKELSKKTTKKALFILDEPSIGQHLEDISRLVNILQFLVENGHGVIIIEHHPHILASCDWLIELGPGGGPKGGKIIASGPPEMIAKGNTPIASYIRNIMEEKK